ncbi:TonB-dependent receptor plug domain-containing protein [Roseateles chitinivorans]|uniref:TonB-dependent receptor plug domain-containing protein n=1 Tax=Roseateles chitinivorans TaxID=2917965 RepID=UPI003D66F120
MRTSPGPTPGARRRRPGPSPAVSSLRKRDEDLHQRTVTRIAASDGGPLATSDAADTRRDDGRTQLTLGSTLVYKLSASDQFTVSPSVLSWRTSSDADERHEPGAGSGRLPDARERARARMTLVSLPLNWRHETACGSQLEIDASPSRNRVRRQSSRLDLLEPAAGAALLRDAARLDRQDVDVLRVDLTPNVGDAHALKLGVNLGRLVYRNDLVATIDGAPDPASTPFGATQDLRGPRHSAFIQDEWTISRRWAATAGVSAEWRRLRIEEGPLSSISTYRVASPSLHVAHKLDDAGARRLRLSLARSFRAPEVEQLTQRPTIHPLAPCSPVACGPNEVTHADLSGNPDLRPERSVGVTATYEQSVGKDTLISLDVFERRLKDVMGEVVGLQAVPWAAVPRYLIRPENLGTARTSGVGLDARIALADVSEALPKVELRAGVTVARSRLDTVPGPDNRMADQSPWSAKLGGKYKLRSMPMELSVDASWTPGLWYRTAVDRRLYQGRRQDLSAQASWTISPTAKFRLGASNLLARDADRADVFGVGARQDGSVWTRRDTAPTLTVLLEMKV